ncbi:disease resistance protein [Striga asiatica]|uniref:Disease resistance protein n=1 Tax=Striga asiatica TaxID=4170 RepID=A0A5A7RFA5_STRAF|nr:disease resistance protein [Striga asiatica]
MNTPPLYDITAKIIMYANPARTADIPARKKIDPILLEPSLSMSSLDKNSAVTAKVKTSIKERIGPLCPNRRPNGRGPGGVLTRRREVARADGRRMYCGVGEEI